MKKKNRGKSKPKEETIIEIAKSVYNKYKDSPLEFAKHIIGSEEASKRSSNILDNYKTMLTSSTTSTPVKPDMITGQPMSKSLLDIMEEQWKRIAAASFPPKPKYNDDTRDALAFTMSGIPTYKDSPIKYNRIGGNRNPEFEYEDISICRVPVKEYVHSMFTGDTIQVNSYRSKYNDKIETIYGHVDNGVRVNNKSLVNNIATYLQQTILEVFEEHRDNRNNLPMVINMLPHMIGYVAIKSSFMIDSVDLSNIMEKIVFDRDCLKHNMPSKIYQIMNHTNRAIHNYYQWWTRYFFNTENMYVQLHDSHEQLYYCVYNLFESHFSDEIYDMRLRFRKDLDNTIGFNVLDPIIQYLIRNTVMFRHECIKELAPEEQPKEYKSISLIKDSSEDMYQKRLEIAAVISSRIELIFHDVGYVRQAYTPPTGYGSKSTIFVDDMEEDDYYLQQQLEDNELYDIEYISCHDIMHKRDFESLIQDLRYGRSEFLKERYYLEQDVNNKVKDKEVTNGSFLDLLSCYNKEEISILLEYESSYDGLKEIYDDKIKAYLSTVPHKAINYMKPRGSYGIDNKSMLEIMSEPTVRLLNSSMIDRTKAYWLIPATRRIYSEMKNCKSGSRYVWLEGLNEFIQERFGIDTVWVNGNGDILLLEKLSPTRLKSIKKTIEFNINKLTLKVAMKLDDKRLRHLLNVAELKMSYVNQILPNAERNESEVIASITGKREVVWQGR